MKKYSFGLLAVLLAVFASAFTAKPKPETPLSNLYWFNPGVTIQSISSVHVATLTDEENNICPGTGSACKDGYSSVTNLGDGRYQANGTATQIFKQ